MTRRFARWVRNHKGTAGAAAAAAIVLVVGGFVASTMARRANERTQNVTRAEGLVESLVNADTQQVPEIVKRLGSYEALAKPLLDQKLAHVKDSSTEKLHLSLALAGSDEGQVDYLYEQLLRADAARFPVIRDALAAHSTRLDDRLWTVLAGRESDPRQQRLRAAGALAKYDPSNAKWTEVAPEVANQLVSVSPVYVGQWQESLRPVAENLLSSLAKIFNDPEQTELARSLATSLLADYAKDDADRLANVVIDADSKAFGALFPVLQSHQDVAVAKLEAVLDRKVEPTWNDPPIDPAWAEPGAAARAAIEASHGILAERFAFCQDLAWDEFAQLAESLRPSGYRPTRVRPWRRDDKPGHGDKLLMAAVWTRDGKRWELETDLAREQFPQGEAPAEKGGLVPADLAVLPAADPAAERRFLLVWGEAATGERRRLVVDASEQELVAAQAAMAKQGFAAQGTVGVWTDAAGQRHYLGIWSNPGAPSEFRAAYGGFELVDQPQWDVAVAAAATLADPLDAFRRQLADIAKLPPAQLDQPQVRLVRAKAEYHLGQLEGALADLDFPPEKLDKKAVSPEALQYRAWTLARLGKAEDARAELAKYLEQASDASTRAYVQVVLEAWLGEFDQAAELLNSAATPPVSVDGLYNAACASALASQACSASDGQRAATFLDRAIELLEAAGARGYQNAGQLRTDVDLAGLHGDPRFLAIVDRLEPPARYAAVWRADVEFESRLVTQPLEDGLPRPSEAEDGLGRPSHGESTHAAGPERAAPRSEESGGQVKKESGDESSHSKLAAQGYRPVAICVFDEGAVAGLARVRDVAAPEFLRIPLRLRIPLLPNPKSEILSASVWHRPLVHDGAKQELAERQATAAVALLRMGATGAVWPLFEHRPDPRLRSYLVDRLAGYGADPLAVLARLQSESDVSRRRVLILGIGQFARAKLLSAQQQSAAVSDLAGRYADDADAGVHGAAEWSLRQLEAQTEIARVRQALATGSVVGERQWYVTKEGARTLVIVRPEEEFLMGSPVAEAERFQGPTGKNEIRHRRRIGRTFAIGAHEVTVEQFQRFRAEHVFDRTNAREGDAPANVVTWYDAAAFCNWLSEKEGIGRDQWCYDPEQPFGDGMALYPDYLQRTGYRLPTEAEWEYSCRAGATTARYFGETAGLLGEYAWYTKNSQDRWMLPVGSLKPNDLGLFDMLGNAVEWCQDAAFYYSKDRAWMDDQEQAGAVRDSSRRVPRGGAFTSGATFARSAYRLRYLPTYRLVLFGFRVARTYP